MVVRKRNMPGDGPGNDGGQDESTVGGATATIGFGGTLGLIGATRGSEYTNIIAKVMGEMYSTLPTPPKVSVFDKERLPNLEYSCIVVSLPNANKEVCYHIVLLEATGSDPMKASDIVAEATRSVREINIPPRIYTPDDAINAKLHEIVLGELAASGNNPVFISTDGLVVHASSLDVNELAMRVAAISYNAVHTEVMLSTGELADLNIAEATKGSSRSTYALETNLYHTTVTGITGSPTRQDFKVDLVEVEQGGRFELNADTRRRLVSVSGYVDAIRVDLAMATQLGMPPATTSRLHPNIVITNNDTIAPTQGFMSLGVVAATVMSRPELWLQSLASIDAKSPNSPGGLNLLTNIENNQTGAGTALDLSPKEVTTEEHYALLKQMYSQSPVISYDVESFGPQTYYSSVLAAAASPMDSTSKVDALAEIVETCVQLTNGIFPADFDKRNIFATTGVVIPLGYWMDKSGERDLRDIDMAFVANQTGDVNLISKWGMSTLPRENTGLDPFLTKIEIINNIVPDAVISGKAVRVTYTSAFICTFAAAVEQAGLVARYDAPLVINEQYDTTQFTDYLAAASLSSATGFARQTTTGGNMYTNYTNMGRQRF